MRPGVYIGMPMRDYLELDALSTTPVRHLLEECPRAGWWHSRLNPNRPREVAGIMDIGSAAHSVVLEKSAACIAVIDPADHPSKTGGIPKGWTNDAIRTARDDARAAGKYPVLVDDMAEINAMTGEALTFIESLRTDEPAVWSAFQDDGGKSEVTIVWDEDGLLCKLRLDRCSNDFAVTIDYKTSGQSVEPEQFARTALSGMGYNFGAAWYRRGIKAATGVDTTYMFMAQETDAPYLCSIVGLDGAWIDMGDERVTAGLKQWRHCLETGKWPGYPTRVCYPEPPAYLLSQWEGAQQGGGYPYMPEQLFERTDK